MRQNAFGGRAPLGECSSSPRPPSRNWRRGAYFQWRSQECELGGELPSLVFQVGLLLVETAAPSNLNRLSAFVLYRLSASCAMASCSE